MRSRMIVKLCGMRDAENIALAEQLEIDMMGFIFYPPSSRYVANRPTYLPKRCKRVGVFVNECESTILERATEFELDYIQLHGSESPQLCSQLRAQGLGVIKAISIAEIGDLKRCEQYINKVDYLLFDTKTPKHGGSGKQFDWSIIAHYLGQTPFLLSGGIGVDDAERVAQIAHPLCAGVDLNSGFEQSPALKDVSRVERFLQQLKKSQDEQNR